ncbi:shikimate kinase AroK [Saccharophagus sp. K07]|uniref:shikimate kinase AroK n=1 Tax=Saccharophagus sp. K07 TaxID=2283636 RepID=UPI001651C5ED|nr:shikimate kinase AroK [Saccharophagus sp. K07]
MTGNIVLVGPMGAGKSTVGRYLASRLSFSFVDTDHLIEERAGADIPWIFDVEGEAGFRARETAILDSLLGVERHVIATGGGIVVRPENHERLKRLGTVIYLTASIDQLLARTAKDKKRPLLQVADPRARIQELLTQRDPLYRQLADYVLQTDGRSSKWVVQHIIQWMAAEQRAL